LSLSVIHHLGVERHPLLATRNLVVDDSWQWGKVDGSIHHAQGQTGLLVP
jgi:hypothetical protein